MNNDFRNTIRNNSFRTLSDHSINEIPSNNVNADDNLVLKKTGKILLVDDNHFINKTNQNLLRKILNKDAGSEMEIILCSDGSDIIHLMIQDQVEGNKIKSILTYENMEYLNGSEAINIIRNFEKLQKS